MTSEQIEQTIIPNRPPWFMTDQKTLVLIGLNKTFIFQNSKQRASGNIISENYVTPGMGEQNRIACQWKQHYAKPRYAGTRCMNIIQRPMNIIQRSSYKVLVEKSMISKSVSMENLLSVISFALLTQNNYHQYDFGGKILSKTNCPVMN